MRYRKIRPLMQISKDTMLVYFNGYMAVYDFKNRCCLKKLKFPNTALKSLLAKSRIASRLLRLEPRACEMINEKVFVVSCKGKIYRFDFQNDKVDIEHEFINDMSSPLTMSKIEDIKNFTDGVYYGEYSMNLEKNAVSIYRRDAYGNWEKVYSFPKGLIHHVHGIVPIKEEQRVFILTGDDNDGSGIWEAKDDFKTVVPVLTGKQKYRSCLFNYKDNQITYITDSPMEQNYVYRYVKTGTEWNESYKEEISGSCIYGEFKGDEFVFSTTVEPNCYFEGKKDFKFYFENKIGDGIKDRNVHVYTGSIETGIKEIETIKKDIFPMRLFQYGAVTFPKYSYSKYNQIHMYGMAVKGMDNMWERRL